MTESIAIREAKEKTALASKPVDIESILMRAAESGMTPEALLAEPRDHVRIEGQLP